MNCGLFCNCSSLEVHCVNSGLSGELRGMTQRLRLDCYPPHQLRVFLCKYGMCDRCEEIDAVRNSPVYWAHSPLHNVDIFDTKCQQINYLWLFLSKSGAEVEADGSCSCCCMHEKFKSLSEELKLKWAVFWFQIMENWESALPLIWTHDTPRFACKDMEETINVFLLP